MSLGTECAGEQGAFWQFRDARIRSGSSTVEGQADLAGDLGLDETEFSACMAEQRYWSSIAEDKAAARTNGIFTQPAFIISSGGESVKRIGWLTEEQLGDIVDDLLN